MRFKAASFVGALALAGAFSFAGDSDASFFRVHASGCFAFVPFGGGSLDWFNDQNGLANGANHQLSLMCPAPDSSTVQRNQFKTVNVETFLNGFNPINASLCEDQFDGSGGTCTGPSQPVTQQGHQTIRLGSFVGGTNGGMWSTASEGNFGFVEVDVDGVDSTGKDGIVKGIFYSTVPND